MKKLLFTLLIYIACISLAKSQGTIRGKVSDKNGETLIGVTVVLKSNPGVGAVTDIDGNYTLRIKDSLPQILVVSYVSYASIEETVNPHKGEVIVKDFVMKSSEKELAVVEISAKATKANTYYMENIKKNSSTTIDYISSETMKKTGDANVVAAVARVAGVSTNGSFITVRGIGDRYLKTTVNGSRIPTLDPFTNNIKLDIFPAALVDNIVITKTYSPDLPGDWAGAYLSVETKDYPEALSVTFETQVGYNEQTTFKDVLSSDRSSTDWLGYDNSFRERDHTQFQSTVTNPTQYQQLVALGLGNYYKSLGITGWMDGTSAGILYFKLGLVQLGLLAPALINNPAAVTAATNAYTYGTYGQRAYATINAGAAKTGQSFPDNWNTTQRKAPLNFSQSFTVGDQFTLFGKPLGFIAGFRYGSTTLYDPNSIGGAPYAASSLASNYEERQLSQETNTWSGLVNLSYKINPNNSIGFMFMPNVIGVNNVKDGYDTIVNTANKSQYYESRKQMVYQAKTEHYFPAIKMKVDLNASYTKGNSNAPDFKYLRYDYNRNTNSFIIDPALHDIHRFYRYLSDNIFDFHGSGEIPLGAKAGLARKIKFGGAYQDERQHYDQYDYYLGRGNYAPQLTNNDVDAYFNASAFGITQGVDVNNIPYSTMNWFYYLSQSPVNRSFGKAKTSAAFAMIDYTVIPRLRLSGGLRAEFTNMFTDVNYYDSLGLSDNDPRRYYQQGTPNAIPGRLKSIDILPSATAIFKLINKEENPTNIRVGYSQTLARPSLREYSNITTYDFFLQGNVRGNPDLKMVSINNYDFRIESYFKNKDNVSLSVFHKDFKNDIELEHADVYTWINADKSNVTGIELEGRKVIIKGLELIANFTWAKSNTQYQRVRKDYPGGVEVDYPEDYISRPMFGQAPYVINGILTYTTDSLGITATVSYNRQGPKLVLGSAVPSIGDVYEMPRNLLDFKLSKKLGKHFTVSFTLKDILNSPYVWKYYYDGSYDVTYDSHKWGRTYLLGVSYKI